MQVTVGQIYDATAAGVLGQLNAKKYTSARIGYRMGKLIKAALAEFEDAEASRMKILNEFGTLPDGAQEWTFATPEARSNFEAQWSDVRACVIDLPGTAFNLDEIDGQLELSAGEFALLDWLVVDESSSVI